jgi:Wzt C-terminal domain/Sulfotransferase domain
MMNELFWPSSEAFLKIDDTKHFNDGLARCTGVAICDEKGNPNRIFYQGQTAHFFYEFEIVGKIDMPAGGLEFCDSRGDVIHGKNTIQYGTKVPETINPNTKLRFHQTIAMEVGAGEYFFGVGLASIDHPSCVNYLDGLMSHEEFNRLIKEHARCINIGSFEVRLMPMGRLLHYGISNLPGDCRVTVVESAAADAGPAILHHDVKCSNPTIFHVTHWKAGSQWIYRILQECVPHLIVVPELGEHQFLYWPLRQGMVYPTVYVTRQQFENVRLPRNWKRFVVIRDLRDTLVSAYFSIKFSHPISEPRLARWRSKLHSMSVEEGLIYLMDEWLPGCAHIQVSWLEAGERLIRYEDLLEHDLEILEPLLLEEFQLPVSPTRFRNAVLKNRFEKLTGGRRQGDEDISAHERKGVAGDWRNYFTRRISRSFKSRYGGLVVETGYEQDLNW